MWICRGVKKKFTCLAGSRIKRVWVIFKTKMFIYQSKANLDEEILFGRITHHLDHSFCLDQDIRKTLVKGMFGNCDFTCHSGP